MTQTQHTPGPWFRGKQSASGWYTVRVADVGCTYGRIVAETMEPGDANFIAAAPELLEAVDRLVRQIVETSAYDDARAGQDPGLLADVEFARNVYAKARGEG